MTPVEIVVLVLFLIIFAVLQAAKMITLYRIVERGRRRLQRWFDRKIAGRP